MTREILPHRRYSENLEFKHLGISYSMMVGFFDDGRVGEVFLGMEKAAGTPMDVMARDVAIMVSTLIQHGAPLDRLLRSLTKDENDQPEGLAGAVVKFLISMKPAPAPSQTVTSEVVAQPDAPAVTKANATAFGYTGDECRECHNFTMVRNGTCLKCETCGSTTGCS